MGQTTHAGTASGGGDWGTVLRTPMPRLALLGALVLAIAPLSGCRPTEAEAALLTWSTPDLPDTPAGRQAAGFLDALNSGDGARLTAFVTEHFTPQGPDGRGTIGDRVRSQQQLYQASRGLHLYAVGASSDSEVTVTVQLRLTQDWREMTFFVEPAPPHRITGVRIAPTDPPAEAGAPLTAGALGREIDAYVARLVEADQFSGVVVVAQGGDVLFERAYGLADPEAGTPNTLGTRFGVASVGKTFTAVAVAQLVEAGRIALDAPVGQYLPELRGRPVAEITVEHLLTHRSGLVDVFEDMERFRAVEASRDPQRDYPPLFVDEPLRFAPGERFEYSNSGFVLLGAVVERVSEQPFAVYLREHVFGPAAMTETTLSADGLDAAHLARPWTRLGDDGELGTGPRHRSSVLASGVASAAGGETTTARDLVRFAQALRSHTLLGAEATALAFTPRTAMDQPGRRYGYGFVVREVGGDRVVGHTGGAPGVDAQFEMGLDSGYTVVVLSNYEAVAAPVVDRVQRLLHRS